MPTVRGVIRRRLLVNYRVDPEMLEGVLPQPFRPKLVDGHGIAGVCLIALDRVHPRFVPSIFGLRSENAAHRIAVEWDTPQGVEEGVYVPRRDTSSRLNQLVGGRMFPGVHVLAKFDVIDRGDDDIRIDVRSEDGVTRIHVEGGVAPALPTGSVFDSIETASEFFRRGSIGWSATAVAGCFECLELESFTWSMRPFGVRDVETSFFSDPGRFPAGSVEFDSALLMRSIPHAWHARAPMRCSPDGAIG